MILNSTYSRHNILLSSFYIVIAAFEIVGECFNNDLLIYITKPLLMPLLIALYYPTWKKQKDFISKLLIGALFFAFIGDVALMLLILNEQFFLIGLGAFMITQVLYIIIFSSELIFAQPIIMLLYIAGQYFIVGVIIKAYKE